MRGAVSAGCIRRNWSNGARRRPRHWSSPRDSMTLNEHGDGQRCLGYNVELFNMLTSEQPVTGFRLRSAIRFGA